MEALFLVDTESPHLKPFTIDFSQINTSRDHPLYRAMGFHLKEKPRVIWDATAGLGKDSFLIASFGMPFQSRVVACERSDVLFQLLTDAHERGLQDESLKATLSLLSFVQGEFEHEIAKGSEPSEVSQIDVIYLDPMFEVDEKKSAKSKKEMEILKSLLPRADAVEEMLAKALSVAEKRVVLKRSIASSKKRLIVGGRELKPDAVSEMKGAVLELYLSRKTTAKVS